MRDLCRKFQISSIEHITALVALYRPGPMDLIPDFIKRRHGEIKIEYEHPLLEPITRETYGVLIYQEQVMQAAQVLAGYSLGARRPASARHGQEKARGNGQAARDSSSKAAPKSNNIPAAKANQIFDLLEKFAGYGFNKSHAAAYAIVAYQTAWLKANYPVEFLSAMMTNDMDDTAKLSILIGEARVFGIEVLAARCQSKRRLFYTGAGQGAGRTPRPSASVWPRSRASARSRSKAFSAARAGGEIQVPGRPLRTGRWPHRQPQGAGSA